jgi:hypothetical protein
MSNIEALEDDFMLENRDCGRFGDQEQCTLPGIMVLLETMRQWTECSKSCYFLQSNIMPTFLLSPKLASSSYVGCGLLQIARS